ncbi:MAG: hypothetical protein KAU20_03810, partial [Nanoarchaeota archaeon]|nr:hypothetical protein [Nanoarchaeota archaeon]
RDWDEERDLENTKDELQLFSKLMGHPLRVEAIHGGIERTIGELIMIADYKIMEPGLSAETAASRLRRIGILVRNHEIMISNTAPGIKTILRDTSWANNHYKILERLPDAKRVEPRVYYPGCNSRGVSLPMIMISDGYYSESSTESTATEQPAEPDMFANPKKDEDLPF